jgi:predicted dehydrogenase
VSDPDLAFVADARMQAYADQLQAFVDKVQGRSTLCGTAEDGRQAVVTIEAMLRASATGQVVNV